jgi:hypothetical protein
MRQVIALIAVIIVLAVGNVKHIYVPNKVVLSEPTPVEQFMDKIAQIETPGGGYHTVNRFGMMGRYQFSPQTVRVLGFQVSKSEFLRSREIHEKLLKSLIYRYDGKVVKGVKITRASILAGAHFAGSNGVITFLTNNSSTGTVDANGTTLQKYMSYFSNFHLPSLI